MKVRCPRCGKAAETVGNPFRPFCSERCKTIDLGNWVSGAYRIPEEQPDEGAGDESGPAKGLKEE